MITLGAMDLLCAPVRDIFGVGIHNGLILMGMEADRQRIREMML